MNAEIAQASAPRGLVHPASRIRRVGEGERIHVYRRMRAVAVVLAGLFGLASLAVSLGPLVGWNVVRLATGSMAPGLPTDSLLIVHRVAASEVVVGDVVMLTRPGTLPVTHRVLSIVAQPGVQAGARDARVFTLKGDANASADVHSYTADRVGLMVVGVPWGGQIVVLLRSPLGLGLLTIAASAIVLWAWWPPRHSHVGPRHVAARS